MAPPLPTLYFFLPPIAQYFPNIWGLDGGENICEEFRLSREPLGKNIVVSFFIFLRGKNTA